MASIRSSGGILAPPLLHRMLDLARRGRQSCPAFDRAVALSAILPLLSADAGRRRRRPRESGDAGGAPCAGQPIGSARCSERAGSSRTAAVDSIARGCAPSAPCARRAHNFPLRRRSPANLGSQPTSVAPGVAVPRYKVRSCLGCAPSPTHSHLSCLPIPPALPISPASPSPTPPSHLSCLLIEMADRRHQQITLLQGMRPPHVPGAKADASITYALTVQLISLHACLQSVALATRTRCAATAGAKRSADASWGV
ncbi:unnamed protein product [Urochloa humidicola]